MTSPTQEPSAATPAVSGESSTGEEKKPGGKLTGATPIHSLEQLRKLEPELYEKVLQGMAQNICHDMREHQERLKELNRKARDGR